MMRMASLAVMFFPSRVMAQTSETMLLLAGAETMRLERARVRHRPAQLANDGLHRLKKP